MKRKLLYGAVILALLAVPVERCEIGRLIPVEVVAVEAGPERVVIRTDTGNRGAGRDFTAAYRNLRETASGYIYLDTAQWLILTGDAAEDVKGYLKSDIGVCRGVGNIDLKTVGVYLKNHKEEIEQGKMPLIYQVEGGFKIN